MRAFFDLPNAKAKDKPKRRRCWECGRRAEHDHHVVPKVLGGTRTVPLCTDCHAKVHDRRAMYSSLLTRIGLRAARARGVQLGRRQGDTGHKWNPARRKVDLPLALSLRKQGVAVKEIAKRFGCSKVAVYAALKDSR